MDKRRRERRSHYETLSLIALGYSAFSSKPSSSSVSQHLISSATKHTSPTSRHEVESHFLIPTELLGLGILLALPLGVLLPELGPSEDSLARPLAGSRGAESFGFGGTFGLLFCPIMLFVLWLKSPGGELVSLCIGG